MVQTKKTYNVPEYCSHLGYLSPKSISTLGRRVAAAYRQSGLGEPETAFRPVKGRLTPVKVYQIPCPVVEETIHKYYDEVLDSCLQKLVT
jgi:hypothetical protein